MGMPTTTVNILNEGQVVQLDLGGKTTALPCRVLGFGGSTVMLAPVVPATAPTAEAIEAGREAYVIVDDDQQVHALRARVGPGSEPGEVVVTVTDSFRLGQRRRYSRAPLSLPATVGALPTLRAATDPSVLGGQYYGPDGPGEARGYPRLVTSSPESYDVSVQQRLWAVSEDLTGVRFPVGQVAATV